MTKIESSKQKNVTHSKYKVQFKLQYYNSLRPTHLFVSSFSLKDKKNSIVDVKIYLAEDQ